MSHFYYYTPRNELRRIQCFWPVRQSVSLSVSQSVSQFVSPVFCQRNSSETVQQNFVKNLWRTWCVDVHICRIFWFILFSVIYASFELWYLAKITCNTPLNCSTEFHETLCSVVDKDILCTCAYLQEIFIWFFFRMNN